MIAKANFFVEHIRDLQRESKRDPILLERTLYAFGLLEALSRVGLPFIFKGGTSLMLLLEHPMRLSTDIDIVVAPDEDINHFVREAGKIFPFASCEEQIRHGHNDIEKRHFKFQYDSPTIHPSTSVPFTSCSTWCSRRTIMHVSWKSLSAMSCFFWTMAQWIRLSACRTRIA